MGTNPMQIETLDINLLHFDPANARKHPERNLDVIASSLVRFGQQKPLVVDANNRVLAGNGTLAAAKSLGWKAIQIVRSELIGIDASAFAIVDNRSAELAEWDPDIISAAMADSNIGDIGFSPSEIDAWLSNDTSLADSSTSDGIEDGAPQPIDEKFQIVIDCEDVQQQKELYQRLSAEGFPCRLLTL